MIAACILVLSIHVVSLVDSDDRAETQPRTQASMVPDSLIRRTPRYSRTQEQVAKADDAMLRGQRLAAVADWEAAASEFRNALDLLPKDPRTQGRRNEYSSGFFESNRKAGLSALRQGQIGKAWERVRDGWCDWLSFTYWKVRNDLGKAGKQLLMDLRIPMLFGSSFLLGAVIGFSRIGRKARTALVQAIPYGLLFGSFVGTLVGASSGYFAVSYELLSVIIGAAGFFLLMGVAIPVPFFAGMVISKPWKRG